MLTTLLLLPLLLSIDDYDGLRGAVVALGDIDGDGVPDLALGHRPRSFGMGEEPSVGWPRVEQEPVVWFISGVDGSVISGLRGSGDFGTEMAVVGDLDGDGAVELLVGNGRRGFGNDKGGVVTLVSAGKGEVLLRIEAPMELRAFGRALAGGMQLTGDPTPDFVIGVQGGALVFDGALLKPALVLVPRAGCLVESGVAEGFVLPTVPLSARPVWPDKLSDGWGSGTYPGMNVSVVCDLDGDGLGEVALSMPCEPSFGEQVKGSGGLAQANARTRIVFSAGRRKTLTLETAGWCVVSGEDLDGDKVPDLVTTTVNVHTCAWSGATGELLWERDYTSGYMLAEGASLSFTSDHDGDGVRDLAMGTNETFFDADTGGVAILSGRTGKSLKRHRVTISPPNKYVGGADVAALGDLDGDGLEELAVWEPVPQRLLVLNGADLAVLWQIDVTSLERPK